MDNLFDLRSDTVTKPSREMRLFMADAEVGDDVYGEDPTVNLLEKTAAELVGKEAALFVPSGTMSNQLALCSQASSGDEIIAEASSHVFLYETAAAAYLSRVQINRIESESGMPDLDDVARAIRPDNYHYPRTHMIWIENTHNACGGAVIPQEYIQKVRSIADSAGLLMHLDGARLWNASIASGLSPKEIASPFDSVSVCFSKGLGAPVGSCFCSSAATVAKARHFRKLLGGGMRQSGILAAGALYAINNNLKDLAADHENARMCADIISRSKYIDVDHSKIQTNMVVFETKNGIDKDEFVKKCACQGVLIGTIGKNYVRAVFHRDISREMAVKASEIMAGIS